MTIPEARQAEMERFGSILLTSDHEFSLGEVLTTKDEGSKVVICAVATPEQAQQHCDYGTSLGYRACIQGCYAYLAIAE